jgi:8-oxo-dGTP pyrophosphatase MutT (NUDIX family)
MSQTLYSHRWMELREDANGEAYVKMAGDAVMVVALTPRSEVLLIREQSIAYQIETTSLPTGGIGDGELPEAAAGRELREETGYRAHDLRNVGVLHPSVKYMQWLCHVYLARDLERAPLKGDETSAVTVQPAPWYAVDDLIASRDLTDCTAIAALCLVRKYLDTHREQRAHWLQRLFESR